MGAWGQARVEGYVCSEEGVPVADAGGQDPPVPVPVRGSAFQA